MISSAQGIKKNNYNPTSKIAEGIAESIGQHFFDFIKKLTASYIDPYFHDKSDKPSELVKYFGDACSAGGVYKILGDIAVYEAGNVFTGITCVYNADLPQRPYNITESKYYL